MKGISETGKWINKTSYFKEFRRLILAIISGRLIFLLIWVVSVLIMSWVVIASTQEFNTLLKLMRHTLFGAVLYSALTMPISPIVWDGRGQIWRIGNVSFYPMRPRFLRWSAIIPDKWKLEFVPSGTVRWSISLITNPLNCWAIIRYICKIWDCR